MLQQKSNRQRYLFPQWANRVPKYILLGSLGFFGVIVFVFWYWFSPKHTDVGYSPKQPIAYSHRLHAGQLGIDCRYCHSNVDKSAHAGVPATEVCMNCHSQIKTNKPEVKKIFDSYTSGKPIKWVKVHSLADYAYFDHSRHVNSGVSCYDCHGRIDKMVEVHQVQPLSMSWCLECHRNPDKHIRPKEFITTLDWSAPNQEAIGKALRKMNHIKPREDCSTCHR